MTLSVDPHGRASAIRLRRLVTSAALVASLAACGATASLAPGAGADATAPTPIPTAAASAAAAASPAPAGGGANAGDVTGLADAATAKMCALLSVEEAKAILGKDVPVAPNGVLFKGLGTNCIWQTDDTMAPATFIKVEITPISHKANADLLALGGAAGLPVTVAEFEATGFDLGPLHQDASLVIALADADGPPSMLIQAPTLDMAKAVAEKVLARLGSLK